jgi:hypothetical protein
MLMIMGRDLALRRLDAAIAHLSGAPPKNS